LCGEFIFSASLTGVLPDTLKQNKDNSTKISYAIRLMQQADEPPQLNTSTIKEILKQPLPKPKEQADLLIRWLATNSEEPGQILTIDSRVHRSIIGAKTGEGFALVLSHLFEIGFLKGTLYKGTGPMGLASATLSFDGWNYYEQMQQGESTYSKAFMAMKFGIKELNHIVEEIFKPAVRQAGFDLLMLSDTPKAGLIDDRLRTEIQTSDILIADLTHDNNGAYWEAGYAEGLGKAVIYTCEEKKFKEKQSHFDTNHHLTIMWKENNPQQAGEDLKATIRATLPHLAKQKDD